MAKIHGANIERVVIDGVAHYLSEPQVAVHKSGERAIRRWCFTCGQAMWEKEA